MNWLNKLRFRFRALSRKEQLDAQMDEEMRAHMEMQTQENIEAGMKPDQARREAMRQFGWTQRIQEDCRDQRGVRWVEEFIQDVRFGFRQLLLNRGFTAVAVLTIALGVGANTAIFSLMNTVLYQTLPVADPGRLVLFGDGISAGVTGDFPSGSWNLFSHPFYRYLLQTNQTLAGITGVQSIANDVHAIVDGGRETEPVNMRLVSGTFFSVLGVNPILGRVLAVSDDLTAGNHPVAVASYSWWNRRFGRDRSVVGKTLTYRSRVYTIIGVAPPEFFGTTIGDSPDVWIPLAMQNEISPGWNGFDDKLFQSLYLIGRLKPGVRQEHAASEMSVLFQSFLKEYSGRQPSAKELAGIASARIELGPAARGLSRLRYQFSTPLHTLMAVVALVLVIVCANIAGLLLARATKRRREIAVRLALGAPRSRLIRQLLTESGLLALLGGGLGLVFASWAGNILMSMVSSGPTTNPVRFISDYRVIGFTLLVSSAAAILFGVIPALRSTRLAITPALSAGRGGDAGERRSRLFGSLVVGQIALCLVLVVGASLFLRSLTNLTSIDPGFDPENVLLFKIDAGSVGYAEDARLEALYRQIDERVSAAPGVRSSGFSMFTFHQGAWTQAASAEGYVPVADRDRVISGNVVTPGFFAALGLKVLSGRTFDRRDATNAPKVAVINETMARRFWPTGQALGRRFGFGSTGQENEFEIVGIVNDAKIQELQEKTMPAAFFPHAQKTQYLGDFDVRYTGDQQSVITAIRSAIKEIDPKLPILSAGTLKAQVRNSLSHQNLIARLSAFFGLLALFLACLGIYGLMSYAVGRRTSEIGIRMALGSRRDQVLRMILRESMKTGLLGVAIGLPLAIACGRLIRTQLYGVGPYDPLTLLVAVCVLCAVALGAAWIPARRASKVDPMTALRTE